MWSRFLPLALLLAAGVAACGGKDGPSSVQIPVFGAKGEEKRQAPTSLGFPLLATKNTTRIPGEDPVADAAAAARAVFPGLTSAGRPAAVVLADAGSWRAALAASLLMAPPVRAPLLLSEGGELPAATEDALRALAPTGSEPAGDAQVIRVGDVPKPDGLDTTDIVGRNDFELARAIDALHAKARGASSDEVLIVSADRPEFAMPAAAWAAKSGDPILFVTRDEVPAATRAALAAHQQPRIYVLGPSSVISPAVTRVLRTLGTLIRVGGQDPQSNAVEFARYIDPNFGWGVVDPGHGLLFANPERPLDAPAAAPLSASGTYGPLLLTDARGGLPPVVEQFLLDIQPGYSEDPVRGVYNHGWIIGGEDAVSVRAQGRIDEVLEIMPAGNRLPSRP